MPQLLPKTTYLVEVDEYLSSQLCALCHTRTTKHARNVIAGDIFPVLVCSSCHTHWNRDRMASLNIRLIFMYMANHKNRCAKPFASPPKKKNQQQFTTNMSTEGRYGRFGIRYPSLGPK
ncbi:hypothetical protein K501DRAFT_270767 [Backusella circina FSU 941]|nr:hypothetical protein K501DRAFT_270767 [Backusella circina FSU 941]